MADRDQIIEVMSEYAAGLDARDWVLWRGVFVDEVVFDLSSWSGQEPRLLHADRVVAAQARLFAELAVTQHFMTNHRVTVEGDRARLLAHMRAEHWIDDAPAGSDRYTMFGYYDDKLVRTDAGWKICEMQLNVTRTEGARWVMDEAARRMKAKRGKAPSG
ncbi:MAG: nuclear transport factor 2 family protein [Gammaproteobacteria bacterium]|nr:nuclear transport factor 2 family protein [Gammaproteobacteria bacterium]